MKKSEFEKARLALWGAKWKHPQPSAEVERDVLAAEAAGVVWDPEDLLPGRLEIDQWGNVVAAKVLGRARSPELTVTEKREVVRRYNLIPEIRRRIAAADLAFNLGCLESILNLIDGTGTNEAGS